MSQYSTGLSSVTNGSATVTGTNTLWASNVSAGDSFTIASTGVVYDVAAVNSNTSITLSVAYAGASVSGAVYAIGTSFTVPDSFPEMSQGDIETATIFTRGMRKIQSRFTGIAINTTAEIGQAVSDHEATNDHPLATTSAKGFLSGADKTKIDTVEDGATADQTKADIDALNIDADTLDGINSLGFDAAGAADTAVSDHVALPDPHTQYTKAPALLDGLRRSVEAASGGNMTVFYTANGLPSYFTRIPQFLCEDVVSGGEIGTGVHEAFIFDGVEDSEIWVGAYQASIINGEAVSQPGVAPAVSINYDNARTACQNAGTGFDIQTNWDWAAIVLWSLANGFESRGNTNYGRHHDNRWEVGTRQEGGVVGSSSGVGKILTGSGPAYWRHDGTYSGISDMVGNVWEWCSGMKIVDGRVFLSADNDIPIESLYADSGFDIDDSNPWSSLNTTGASEALKRALVAPKGINDPIGRLYVNVSGERLPFRGGTRSYAGAAGLGALNLKYSRTFSVSYFGFRPRFRNL